MKRLLLAFAFVSCGLLTTACPAAPPSLSPAGKTAYTADQIVLRVNELQAAAIQANTAGGLDDATTRLIVQFAVTADTTLKAAPQGWQVTITTGWNALKRQLPMITNPTLAATIATVDVAVATIGG